MIILNKDVRGSGDLNIDHLLTIINFDDQDVTDRDGLSVNAIATGTPTFKLAGESSGEEFDATELFAYLLHQDGYQYYSGSKDKMAKLEQRLRDFSAGGVDVHYFQNQPDVLAGILVTNSIAKSVDLVELLNSLQCVSSCIRLDDRVQDTLRAILESKIRFNYTLGAKVLGYYGMISMGIHDAVHNGMQTRIKAMKAAFVLGETIITRKYDDDRDSTRVLATFLYNEVNKD